MCVIPGKESTTYHIHNVRHFLGKEDSLQPYHVVTIMMKYCVGSPMRITHEFCTSLSLSLVACSAAYLL